MRVLIELCYDGSGYAGFQVQPELVTVQSALQDALERVYGVRYPLKGCSRTDSGVHAKQYFATYDTDRTIPCERLPLALNAALPPDIAILSAKIVPDEFHVRHDVDWKEYEYLIRASRIRDPFVRGRVFILPVPLDDEKLARMQKAADAFVGTHDFVGFMAAGSKMQDTIRTVKYLKIERRGDLISLRIAADGFLYNMVRIIVGTLVEAARGRFSPEEMPDIIASRDRSRAGFTAPAEGLYLSHIEFKPGTLNFQQSEK